MVDIDSEVTIAKPADVELSASTVQPHALFEIIRRLRQFGLGQVIRDRRGQWGEGNPRPEAYLAFCNVRKVPVGLFTKL